MPFVSIIVPCYNEQATIGLLLEALYAQDFPRGDMEVIIADGLSTDATREQINIFQRTHPELSIRIVDNPQQSIPSGLNRAISAAGGEYIIRLDAHSKPQPDYVLRCIEDLEKRMGDNVGGVWEIHPGNDGWIARAIAVAAAHPLGAGDARYRLGGEAQAVDTVPFGAFRRDLVARIGMYDETLLTNEDYEFNTRIRQAGGTVWFDPSIRIIYYARSDLAALARQYWRYGYWKARMLRRYPQSLRWRQLLPPVFVAGLALLGLMAPFWNLARFLFYFGFGAYAAGLLGAGLISASQKRDIGLIIGLPAALATMHLAWGAAFIWSMLTGRE